MSEPTAALRSHFANLLDVAEDGIVTVNQRQEIVAFNRGAEHIFGMKRAEAIGQSLDLLIPVRFLPVHRTHVDTFSQSSVEARLMGERTGVFGRRKDGTEFPADVSISKVMSDGQLFLTAIVRDVTDRRRAEEAVMRLNQELEIRVAERTTELREANRQLSVAVADLEAKTAELRATTQQLWQAAKLASVGELAASIAHELNNPLGIVALRLESILAKTPPEDPRRSGLQIVEQELERMAHLVANLLQFSHPGREAASSVDLADEMTRTLELMHHQIRKRSIEVVPRYSSTPIHIHADRQKLRQVFLNLVANACDAMTTGGRLTLAIRHESANDKNVQVVIEVSDTGQGIPAENLPRVMDPFFTTKEEGKGTGLGLAICRRIVQEHQGSIHIDSTVGKGTTVRITLPLTESVNVATLEPN